MDQGRLPPREPGELEISAPVSLPHAPLPARTCVLLAAVALLTTAAILAVTLPAAGRGLATARAQATATAATVRQVRAARATLTVMVRHAVATQTAAVQATVGAKATIASIATTAYKAAVPGCPLGDPLWQTQNFDPANPNFICTAAGLQISTGASTHFGLSFCPGCPLALKHEVQIHFFAIQPNVATVQCYDRGVMLALNMDGSWQIVDFSQGQAVSGTYPLPDEFTVRIRYDGRQETVAINDVTYATLSPSPGAGGGGGGVSIDFSSRDEAQPSAISVNDFAYTPLP